MEQRYKHDVFLGYSEIDAQIVEKIAQSLREGGLRIWPQDIATDSTDFSSHAVRSGLSQSRILLLFVSQNLIQERWPHLEEETFRFRDPTNFERRFIPVRLDDTELPITLRQVECIEWKTEEADSIVSRLVAVCKPGAKKPTSRGVDVPRLSTKKRYRFGSDTYPRCIKLDIGRRTAVYGTRKGEVYATPFDQSGTYKKKFVGHQGPVNCVDIHKTQPFILSGSMDRTARLWDLDKQSCVRVFTENASEVTTVRFADTAIIICLQDGAIQIWEDLDSVTPRTLRGHVGEVHAVEAMGATLLSAGADRTVRLWNIRSGQCLRVLEGHVNQVTCLALSEKGTFLLSGSADRTIRLWDIGSGLCLNTFDAHTDTIHSVAWHPSERAFVSGGGDRALRLWSAESGKLLRVLDGGEQDSLEVAFDVNTALSADAHGVYEWTIESSLISISEKVSATTSTKPSEQVQYTNAKVLLVGDSGAGKTGLSKRLASGEWEPNTASTVGAWATQWSLPASMEEHGDREIWLWDFGGQADQRLIHQLYMDETSLAVLVFDAQKANVFEALTQWDRDISRSTGPQPAKLLVAGRVDASPVRVSRQDIDEYVKEHGFLQYIETSALTNQGCRELRDTIISSIDWTNIPWRSSPVLFKRLKEEIVKLKDEGRILMRFNELRDALRLRLPPQEINFADAELKAVLSLLSGPGVVLELEFGAWVLFQPELINAYGQAVIATMRDDPSELGCVSEQRVLEGDLVYGGFERISSEDERFVLLEMHRKLLQRGLCAKELTEKDVLLVFPSYYKRNRPELSGHPAVLVSYIFDGIVDEIYSTLVVRLHHTHTFKREKLWQDAADFITNGGAKIGVKLSRKIGNSAAAIEVYCDTNTLLGDKIVFVKYVHDHLLQRATGVVRRRHYVCQSCHHPIADHEAAEKRRNLGKDDLGCPVCDTRIRLIDDLEEQYTSSEYQRKVRRMEEQANEELDNESKERMLVGEVTTIVASAGQISREKSISDYGIDMEIEFKNTNREATGKLLFLQLKSGDSYIRTSSDGKEFFSIKNERHVKYWADQMAPVMLVIRNSSGEIRWMEIRNHLREKIKKGESVKRIEFKGEQLDVASILKWRDHTLTKSKK